MIIAPCVILIRANSLTEPASSTQTNKYCFLQILTSWGIGLLTRNEKREPIAHYQEH